MLSARAFILLFASTLAPVLSGCPSNFCLLTVNGRCEMSSCGSGQHFDRFLNVAHDFRPRAIQRVAESLIAQIPFDAHTFEHLEKLKKVLVVLNAKHETDVIAIRAKMLRPLSANRRGRAAGLALENSLIEGPVEVPGLNG